MISLGPWSVTIGENDSIVIVNQWCRIAEIDQTVTGWLEAKYNGSAISALHELLEVAELVLYRDSMIQVSTELAEKAQIAVDKARGLIL